MSKRNKKKKVRKNSNYKNNYSNKRLPVNEELGLNPMWTSWQLGLIKDERSFYNAVKNGEYVVGFDSAPYGGVVYQNVFHYCHGRIEIFKFVPNALANMPCKLLRDVTIGVPEDVFELVGDELIRKRYDGFLISHNGIFLDTKNIPQSILD